MTPHFLHSKTKLMNTIITNLRLVATCHIYGTAYYFNITRVTLIPRMWCAQASPRPGVRRKSHQWALFWWIRLRHDHDRLASVIAFLKLNQYELAYKKLRFAVNHNLSEDNKLHTHMSSLAKIQIDYTHNWQWHRLRVTKIHFSVLCDHWKCNNKPTNHSHYSAV